MCEGKEVPIRLRLCYQLSGRVPVSKYIFSSRILLRCVRTCVLRNNDVRLQGPPFTFSPPGNVKGTVLSRRKLVVTVRCSIGTR